MLSFSAIQSPTDLLSRFIYKSFTAQAHFSDASLVYNEYALAQKAFSILSKVT